MANVDNRTMTEILSIMDGRKEPANTRKDRKNLKEDVDSVENYDPELNPDPDSDPDLDSGDDHGFDEFGRKIGNNIDPDSGDINNIDPDIDTESGIIGNAGIEDPDVQDFDDENNIEKDLKHDNSRDLGSSFKDYSDKYRDIDPNDIDLREFRLSTLEKLYENFGHEIRRRKKKRKQ